MCSFLNMIAGAASGVYQGTIQNAQNNATYEVQSAQTDSENLLSQDQADNNNKLREAGNEFAAAQASLANTQRSISNQQKASAAGSQWNTTTLNQDRALDTMVRGNVEQQISAAGALGALNADAAARGVGGTSADIMRSTMRGRNARLVSGQQLASKETNFDDLMVQSGMRSNLVTSQDYGQTVANLNYQASIPTTYIKPAKMPDLTYTQMELMGAAGGGGFQQFSQSRNSGGAVGFSDNGTGNGSVGETTSYSSEGILNGVDSISNQWTDTNAGSGSSSSQFNFNLGGDSSGSSSNFDFSL
jgi:hypothetical protein